MRRIIADDRNKKVRNLREEVETIYDTLLPILASAHSRNWYVDNYHIELNTTNLL